MDASKSFLTSILLLSFLLFFPLAYAASTCPASSEPKSPIVGKPPYTDDPPIIGGSSTVSLTTPPPVINPPPASCPADSLKVWARVDLFGGHIHIEVGDPAANQCCEMPRETVLDLEEDTVCFCTTIKLRLLGVNAHLALQLPLITCAKAPPPVTPVSRATEPAVTTPPVTTGTPNH